MNVSSPAFGDVTPIQLYQEKCLMLPLHAAFCLLECKKVTQTFTSLRFRCLFSHSVQANRHHRT